MREGSAPNFCPPTEEGVTLVLEDETGEQTELEFLGLILHHDRSYGFFYLCSRNHHLEFFIMQFYDVFFHRDTDFIVIFTKVNNLNYKVTQSGIKNSMFAKLIRRIKCYSVQEILMIVSIIMLLIVIASRTSAGIKARSATSGQITQVQKPTDLSQE